MGKNTDEAGLQTAEGGIEATGAAIAVGEDSYSNQMSLTPRSYRGAHVAKPL